MMRPWYVKAADATHRLVVLGIIAYSGWLVYGIGASIKYNYDHRGERHEAKLERKQLEEEAKLRAQSDFKAAASNSK